MTGWARAPHQATARHASVLAFATLLAAVVGTSCRPVASKPAAVATDLTPAAEQQGSVDHSVEHCSGDSIREDVIIQGGIARTEEPPGLLMETDDDLVSIGKPRFGRRDFRLVEDVPVAPLPGFYDDGMMAVRIHINEGSQQAFQRFAEWLLRTPRGRLVLTIGSQHVIVVKIRTSIGASFVLQGARIEEICSPARLVGAAPGKP